MGLFHVAMLILAALFVALYVRVARHGHALRPRRAAGAGRRCAVLAPFVWLVAAIFKDPRS